MSNNQNTAEKKGKKVVNIIVNVVVGIILALVLILTLSTLLSGNKGYTNVFGKSYVAVLTDSMSGEKPAAFADDKYYEGFNAGDLIFIDVYEEGENIEVGDIISFHFDVNGDGVIEVNEINTHRVIGKNGDTLTTQGDYNSNFGQIEYVSINSVIGVYTGVKIGGLGSVLTWMKSSIGFFICIVIPAFAVLVYYFINFITVFRSTKEEAVKLSAEEERERIRQELLAEMNAANNQEEEADDTSENQ